MLEDLFHQAAELPPDQRARFVDEHRGLDSKLRARLQELLRAWDGAGRFLSPHDAPTEALNAPDPGNRFVGQRVGPYQILRLIATGGMGSVFEAEQDRPRRPVALKLMKSGIASRSALRRFEFEAQLLARLRHTGIAQIYEAGAHVDQQGLLGPAGATVPFFAMEYIPAARAICDYARVEALSMPPRLELFCRACDAVHHGHSKGIIHRDVKPSNILVDSSGQPKVIDFGVARSTDSDLALTTMQTSVGQLVGTLQYMSPEQCAADPHDLDIRTDVYSLGVVLYELLLGKLPYDVGAQPVFEAIRTIREQPPARPSSFDRTLRGDLETIVLKVLEKDRGRRYQSAAALAEDIRRLLANEPISARPPSVMYHLRTFTRRNRVLVGGAAATVLALVLGLIGTATFAVHAQRQRRLADEHAAMVQGQSYRANIAAARGALSDHDSAMAVHYLDSVPPALRGWEWRWRRGLYGGNARIHSVPAGHHCLGLAGDAILYSSGQTELALFDLLTGEEKRRLRLGITRPHWCALSPAGDAALIHFDNAVSLFDLQSGLERWRGSDIGPLGYPGLQAFSQDGRLLVLPEKYLSKVRVLDASSGETVQMLDAGAPVRYAGVSPDARIVFADTAGDSMPFIDRLTGEILWRTSAWMDVQFSPDSRHAAAFIAPNFVPQELRVFRAATGAHLATIDMRRGGGAAFNPDSSILATIEHATEVTLRDGNTFEMVSTIRDPSYMHGGMAFARDGGFLVTWNQSGFRTLDVRPRPNPMVVRWKIMGESSARRRVSQDGRRVAVTDWGTVTVFDAVRGGCDWTRCLGSRQYSPLAFSPDNRILAAIMDGPCVVLFSASDGNVLTKSESLSCAAVEQIDWTPDACRIVAATEKNEIVVLDAITLRRASCAVPQPDSLRAVRLTDDESGVVLCTGHDSTNALVPTGGAGPMCFEQRRLAGSTEGVRRLAVDPQRRHLAAGDDAGHVIVWDLPTGSLAGRISVSTRGVECLAFSRDGTRLAVSTPERIALIDVSNWELVDSLPQSRQSALCLRFGPGDEALLAGGAATPVVRFELSPPEGEDAHTLAAARELNRRAAAVLDAIPPRQRQSLDETLEQINQDSSLSPELRRAAIAFAGGLGENPNWLNSMAWGIARSPAGTPDEYRKAVQYVKTALTYLPDDFAYLNTLGAAQYRAGDCEDAIVTMERADQVYDAGVGEGPRGSHPANRVFIAMAHARLGRLDIARTELDRVRKLMSDAQFARDEETAEFVREAEGVISRTATANVPE